MKVLILGNGKSRLKLKDFIKNWKDEIWVCNKGYLESLSLSNITRVYSVHPEVIQDAQKYKDDNNLIFNVHGPGGVPFLKNKGWSSGSQALLDALLEKRDISVVGFDFGGPDVYQPLPVNGSNFIRQSEILKKEFEKEFIKVKFIYPEA